MVETGFLGDWPNIVPKEVILRFALDDVAGGNWCWVGFLVFFYLSLTIFFFFFFPIGGWRRWRGLPSGTTSISQAHALADTGIMYYLLDNAPEHISLVEETVTLPEGGTLPVLRL